MPSLPLAVDIADAVSKAHRRQSPLDVGAKADHLLNAHPEADETLSDIADTLREESAAVGALESSEPD